MKVAIPKLIVFREDECHGDCWTFNDSNEYCKQCNDCISSLIITDGKWQFFQDDHYGGAMSKIVGPGIYKNVEQINIGNDSISSFKLVGKSNTPFPCGHTVVVFRDCDFNKEGQAISIDVEDVGFHWNDGISSLVAISGKWVFYKDKNYEGKRSIIVEPGGYTNIEDIGLENDCISSFRRILETDVYKLVSNVSMLGSPSVINYNEKLYCFYQAEYNHDLHYIVFDGSKWGDDTLVPNVRMLESPSVINYNEKLYCFYQAEYNHDLHYIVFDGSKWGDDTLVPNVRMLESPSVINYNEKLYCFYQAEYNHDLHYIVFDGSEWGDDTLVPNVRMLESPSVINYNEKLYCFYQAEYNHDLHYIVFDGSKWGDDTLVPNVRMLESPSVINYNEKLYCFHQAEYNRYLRYIVFDGSKWGDDTLVPNVRMLESPSVINYNEELYCFHQGVEGGLWYIILDL